MYTRHCESKVACQRTTNTVTLANVRPYTHDLLSDMQADLPDPLEKKSGNNTFCYIAEIFLSTAHALTGYFKVTLYLTVRLFPAKVSECATVQNI